MIPGATVVAVNVGTKDTYETTTNTQGYYNIQFVRIGQYDITVTLSGFQTFKATGIAVATNQVVRRDAALQVGVMSETITVAAGAAMLSTENATLVETINERAVEELPLSGRNVWSLAGTTPGVLGGTSSFTGAGQRNIQNSLSMDGINTAANLLTATSMRPISDAVTEVQVQTGSTSAEYGSYLGVHVNVVTKSGTNQIAREPLRVPAARLVRRARLLRGPQHAAESAPAATSSVFRPTAPSPSPSSTTAATRTFFMVAYEGVRSKETSTSISSVPTALMRQENFSEISAAIRNPFTGQLYAGNIRSPVADSRRRRCGVLEFYPPPNRSGTASNLVATGNSIDDQDQILTRVDQNLGNKVRLYLRYNWQDQFDSSIGAIPVTGTGGPNTNHNTLVAYTHTLTPRCSTISASATTRCTTTR